MHPEFIFYSDIYLTATTLRHLTRQLNYVTSIVATGLSHFLNQAAIDKLLQSDYRLHLIETTKSRKVLEIKGFRAYFPLTFDINTTVSTCNELAYKYRHFPPVKGKRSRQK